MTFQETMAWLAENYLVGIGVSSAIVIIIYITCSVLILLKSRKMGVDVSLGAMVPLWHLKYLVQGINLNKPPKRKAVKKPKTVESEE